MDIRNVSQLLTGINNGQGNQNDQVNSPIPEIPLVTPTSIGADIGTDFGAASAYTPGEQSEVPETFAPDMNRVSQMWNRHQERVDAFRQMIETLIGQQAERQGLAMGWSFRDIEVTEEMRAEAQEMIDEGGYYSVEEVASRILDFAVAITGGDPAQIDLMRNAIQRGFDQAERMFGGELPEITHETHAAVMNGFDEWAENGAAAISLLTSIGGA